MTTNLSITVPQSGGGGEGITRLWCLRLLLVRAGD
jgi:hypothetical protein